MRTSAAPDHHGIMAEGAPAVGGHKDCRSIAGLEASGCAAIPKIPRKALRASGSAAFPTSIPFPTAIPFPTRWPSPGNDARVRPWRSGGRPSRKDAPRSFVSRSDGDVGRHGQESGPGDTTPDPGRDALADRRQRTCIRQNSQSIKPVADCRKTRSTRSSQDPGNAGRVAVLHAGPSGKSSAAPSSPIRGPDRTVRARPSQGPPSRDAASICHRIRPLKMHCLVSFAMP